MIAMRLAVSLVASFLLSIHLAGCCKRESCSIKSLVGIWEVVSFSINGKELFPADLRQIMVISMPSSKSLVLKAMTNYGAEVESQHYVDGNWHTIKNMKEKMTWDVSNAMLVCETQSPDGGVNVSWYYTIGNDMLMNPSKRHDGAQGVYVYKKVRDIPWNVIEAKKRIKKKYPKDQGQS